MRKVLIITYILISLFACLALAVKAEKPTIKCNYLIYVPDTYKSEENDFPLIIYLHGKSHRGNDLDKLKGYGLPYLISKGHKYNFIIASPQCPDTTYWSSVNWFDALYNELTEKYRIDKDRVFVTGISLGGYGTWQAAMDHPDKIAAIVPMCGGCADSAEICRIKDIPVWAFHGTKDEIVKIIETEDLVNRLKACNGKVRFTKIENAGHDITNTFENQEIYDWLIKQKKK